MTRKFVLISPVQMRFHEKFVWFRIWASGFLGMVIHHISTCTADHPDQLVCCKELHCIAVGWLVGGKNNSHVSSRHNSHTRYQPQPQNDPSVTSCTYPASSSVSCFSYSTYPTMFVIEWFGKVKIEPYKVRGKGQRAINWQILRPLF